MFYYTASNKTTLALIFSTLLSLVVFFNSDSYFIKTIKSYWLDLRLIVSSPLIEITEFVSSKDQFRQFKLYKLKLALDSLNYSSKESYIEYLEEVVALKNRFILSDASKFYTANVLSHSNPQISSSVIIDIGKEDFGFKKESFSENYIAVDIQGNLIGRIIDIGNRTSVVQLINDVNNKVIVENKERASFVALMVPFSGSKCKLLGVSLNSNIMVGDTMITSYKSDIYLKDIPVCVVTDVFNKEENSPFKKVFVKILADLGYMRNLFIINAGSFK